MKLSASALNANSLQKLADELRDYANSLPTKIEQFLNALADRGIEVARQNEGDFTGYIVYSKEPLEVDAGELGMKIVARDVEAITVEWYVSSSPSSEIRSDTFSPLLMAEYGSGAYQVKDAPVGRLPKSMGHGGDEEGWSWWTDDASYRDGEYWIATSKKTGRYLFWSKGSHPTMPIHNAVMKMIEEIDSIARSVFG